MDEYTLMKKGFNELLEYWTEIFTFQNENIAITIERLNSSRRINANMILMMEKLSEMLKDDTKL
jgi:hypothetical protein